MKTTSYTPGPLHIQPIMNDFRILGGPRLSVLAEVRSSRTHNGAANARLFAAAPDLLAATQAAERYIAGEVTRGAALGVAMPAHTALLEQLRTAIDQAVEVFS